MKRRLRETAAAGAFVAMLTGGASALAFYQAIRLPQLSPPPVVHDEWVSALNDTGTVAGYVMRAAPQPYFEVAQATTAQTGKKMPDARAAQITQDAQAIVSALDCTPA